jgi:hypothetical protein
MRHRRFADSTAAHFNPADKFGLSNHSPHSFDEQTLAGAFVVKLAEEARLQREPKWR